MDAQTRTAFVVFGLLVGNLAIWIMWSIPHDALLAYPGAVQFCVGGFVLVLLILAFIAFAFAIAVSEKEAAAKKS